MNKYDDDDDDEVVIMMDYCKTTHILGCHVT